MTAESPANSLLYKCKNLFSEKLRCEDLTELEDDSKPTSVALGPNQVATPDSTLHGYLNLPKKHTLSKRRSGAPPTLSKRRSPSPSQSPSHIPRNIKLQGPIMKRGEEGHKVSEA